MAKIPFVNVKVDGVDKPLDPLVRAVTVEDNDRLVDEARLTFEDPDGKGAALFDEKQKLRIDLGWDDEHAVIFEGLVVERHPAAGADGKKSLMLVARDLSQQMVESSVKSALTPGALDSIVKQLASRNGFADKRAHITCDPNPTLTDQTDLKPVANETDYHFLQRLAERYGARAFVEYNDGDSQFYFVSNRSLMEAKPLGQLEYCRGFNKLIEFKYSSIASRSAKQYVVSTVDPVSGETKTATGDPAPSPPSSDPSTPPATPAAPVAATGPASDTDLLKRTVVTDPTRVLGLRGTGRAVGTVILRAKGKVTIAGLAPWAEGDWYVAQATHQWTDTRTAEDVKAGRRRASYETSFVATR